MGKLKDELLKLEEDGLIEWSDYLAGYIDPNGDPGTLVDVNKYLNSAYKEKSDGH